MVITTLGIYTSKDLHAWNFVYQSSSLLSVTFGEGLWVVLTSDSVLISKDTMSWQAVYDIPYGVVTSVGYVNGKGFIILGQWGLMITSRNNCLQHLIIQ